MSLEPIKNEKDYSKALGRVDELMELNPELGTSYGDELEIIAMLIEKYEEKEWTISDVDPICQN